MSADIARTLRDGARERRSFLVIAIPRLAGKTTVMRAMLAERRGGVPLRTVGLDGEASDQLIADARGGYVAIPEIAEGPWAPGYIRGAPVRRVFRGLGPDLSLAAALHAPDPATAFELICGRDRVRVADAAKVSLVVYLRSLGQWQQPSRRVVATVHAVDCVVAGRPAVRLLHRWDEQRDVFEVARG